MEILMFPLISFITVVAGLAIVGLGAQLLPAAFDWLYSRLGERVCTIICFSFFAIACAIFLILWR